MRFERILLVNPPGAHQDGFFPSPLGLLYLASFLRKKSPKVAVHIVDATAMGKWSLIEELVRFKPDLVGISTLTPSRHKAVYVAKLAKKLIPGTKTVLGNVHPTIMWHQMMEHYPEIDFIVRGEGEETLWELVSGLALPKIKGLIWRKNNRVFDNTPRPMIKNIDSLPIPAWDLIDPQTYPPRGSGMANGIDLAHEIRYPIIFSRGCMGACTFCSSWIIWKGYRFRSGKNVADEVEYLTRNFHARHFVFQDDTLTGSRKDIMYFCREIIRRKLKIAIYGTTRVDKVDLQMLKLMKKAGFYEIAYGIESGSPDMLAKINKKTDIRKIERAIRLTRKARIRSCALMMYGLPHEKEKDRKYSEKLLRRIKPDEIGSVGAVWVFPGTPLYYQAKAAKLIDDSFWLGSEPYYIYRGGIGNDKFNVVRSIVDRVSFKLKDYKLLTFLRSLPDRTIHLAKRFNIVSN